MADEFHTGLCGTMSWWTTMRTPTSFDLPLPLPLPSPISCTTDHQSFSWSTQPFLPAVELNEIQTGFGDSSMSDQTLLAGLFEPEVDMISDDPAVMQPASWPKFSTGNSTTHYHQLSRVSSPSKQQLSFSDNAPVWNPLPKIPEPRFEDESSGTSNLTSVKISETKRHGSTDQPAAKKARIAMPSPLPTFKVRKEKLGDRITALQQLVSPFGKTDTASVLHEAIEYIKFLHGQVGALSTPYMKNGHQMQHHKSMESTKDEGVQDLRGRGLCLVPISSTFAVASETPMEFWAPTFLGSYR